MEILIFYAKIKRVKCYQVLCCMYSKAIKFQKIKIILHTIIVVSEVTLLLPLLYNPLQF